MQSKVIQIVLLLIAMASIQTGASIAKGMFSRVGTFETTLLRLLISAIILLLTWRPWRKFSSLKSWRYILLYGISLGWMNLMFYMALKRIPLGLAVALEFSGPLAVAILSSKRVIDIVWTFFAMAGILLILPLRGTIQSVDFVGVMFALGAGLFWASYILFGKKASAVGEGGIIASCGAVFAFIAILPMILIQGVKVPHDVEIIPLAISMAILSSAFPYTLEMIALKNLNAKTFSIFMSLEPALAAISGLLFLNESLTLTQWMAISCVMIASAGSSLS